MKIRIRILAICFDLYDFDNNWFNVFVIFVLQV